MNILLIDADSTIPNLALMKISTYHKSLNDNVSIIRLNLPYYPNRKKEPHNIDTSAYDHVFCSVIFEGNKEYVNGYNITFGGTGYDLTIKLPAVIENLTPDYSLYPENNVSYGFISRGCIRNCYFCKVPKKEGKIRQVSNIKDIIQHKKVKFLDNNFLALPNHKELLQELININIKCQFNQGLDIRLIDEESSLLLSRLNYLQEYIFAFDDIKYKDLIEDKLKILYWRKDWGFKFFIYCNPEMKLSDSIKRIEFLKERKCLPYFMRDVSCWDSEYNKFYVDLAAWCNQPNVFKYHTFFEFLNKRHKDKERIKLHKELYYE